jgi:hypothetical protein
MGQHADDARHMAIDEEGHRDDYVAGHMSLDEAFERDFIRSDGSESEGITAAWDRAELLNYEGTCAALKDAEKDLEIATLRSQSAQPSGHPFLNQAAVVNLQKSVPTCNTCSNPMTPRNGKFGKFYFCPCPDQVTVSDAYWQQVRHK